MSETFDTAKQLKRIIAEGRISEESIIKTTGISENDLSLLLNEENPHSGRFFEESARISMLTAQLTHGIEIQDDERVAGIINGLVGEFQFSLENIALLTGIGVQEIQDFLDAPESTPSNRKYELASRVSYLNMVVANARPS
ncbi:hypothetical protein G7066_02805 [Leucobacter coleopterorum]|uniref:Uncharacterized protein n=1 Tax=Leucobacter coleopterorum TaxID=2714933 RepID=A0ABX6JYF5_9MICO|nr:HTH domain-containing protein [Leucobacter coleopterorum]QIM17879.1 hypothetical protein G7066_02805 [Leucobacter coleopterorum]